MLGMQVMVQKNCVVRICAQKDFGLVDVIGEIDLVAFKATCEPMVPPRVVIEQEYSNRAPLSSNFDEPELC